VAVKHKQVRFVAAPLTCSIKQLFANQSYEDVLLQQFSKLQEVPHKTELY